MDQMTNDHSAMRAFETLNRHQLLSQQEFLDLHQPPETNPLLQQKTLESVALSFIPSIKENAPFRISRSKGSKKVRIEVTDEFKTFAISTSKILQNYFQKQLDRHETEEKSWALLACAACYSLQRKLEQQNASFLAQDEFKTVRGIIFDLELQIGFRQSSVQQELSQFFENSARHQDSIDAFNKWSLINNSTATDVFYHQILTDYEEIDYNSAVIHSDYGCGSGPDLDDFLDENDAFSAVRSANLYVILLLEKINSQSEIVGFGMESCNQVIDQQAFQLKNQPKKVRKTQVYTQKSFEIPSFTSFVEGEKTARKSKYLSQRAPLPPIQEKDAEKFAEILWSIQLVGKHIFTHLNEIQSQSQGEKFIKNLSDMLDEIDNQISDKKFLPILKVSQIDQQIDFLKRVVGL